MTASRSLPCSIGLIEPVVKTSIPAPKKGGGAPEVFTPVDLSAAATRGTLQDGFGVKLDEVLEVISSAQKRFRIWPLAIGKQVGNCTHAGCGLPGAPHFKGNQHGERGWLCVAGADLVFDYTKHKCENGELC